MRFRPCIDLHDGVVKQLVGGTLIEGDPAALCTNFVAEKPPAWFAELYRRDGLTGGHVIRLGPGNDTAAGEALAAWPGGLQLGGGIDAANASYWLDQGASHVIVTSAVFSHGRIDWRRLQELVAAVGRQRLVLDLSCRRRGDEYWIVTDRWQKFTAEKISPPLLESLARCCDEFLVHAADVEGRCAGIELELVARLGQWSPLATTYAGGVRNLDDLRLLEVAGGGRLDATIGSALDIFGGTLSYREVVSFCHPPFPDGWS
jgi:phosphoribosylformimino-5-aminoimidazole carboxamide ribotide isomerase